MCILFGFIEKPEAAMAEKLLDYRRIAVKGITALEQAGRFTIRVFAQVKDIINVAFALMSFFALTLACLLLGNNVQCSCCRHNSLGLVMVRYFRKGQ